MLTLSRSVDRAAFFRALAAAPARALLLDYDGTIAPFCVDPGHAVPYPSVRELLKRIISTTPTRVVMVSGRPARQLAALLGIQPQPEIWGTHGLERLKPDGSYEMVAVAASQRRALEEAEARLAGAGLNQLVEIKPGAIALHWRGLEPQGVKEARDSAYRILRPPAEAAGLELAEFDGGLELRLPDRDKGDAVRTLLQEMGDDAVVAYLGDDHTDEDAFRALRPQDLGVLVRPEFRDTAANLWIRPPQELVQFLIDWLRAGGGEA